MKLSVKAVIIGNLVDGVLSAVIGLGLGIYAATRVDMRGRGAEQAAEAVSSFIHTDATLRGTLLVSAGLTTMLAGYISARIAKHDEVLNGAAAALVSVLLVFYMQLVAQKESLIGDDVLATLLGVGGAILGGYLRLATKKDAAK